jgi:arginase
MDRRIAIIGAPSSIGIKPYDDGAARHLDEAPAVLRDLGLVQRVGATDLGDVSPPAYRDFMRQPGRVRNEAELAMYSIALGERVAAALSNDHFPVVLGGDCSIVLGCLLGARHSTKRDLGLLYLDAHADFASPEESHTGSAASMCLALAIGHGHSPLATLDGRGPLARAAKVVAIGRRDAAEPWYGHADLAASGILDIPDLALRSGGTSAAVAAAMPRLTSRAPGEEDAGFWIHLDADFINPIQMPAVDSPEPGGPMIVDVAKLLMPFLHHPRALGLELTIYDPRLDPDHSSAQHLVSLLEMVLLGVGSPTPSAV